MVFSTVIWWHTFFPMEKYHATVRDSIDFAVERDKELRKTKVLFFGNFLPWIDDCVLRPPVRSSRTFSLARN
jgi:hypothetical protein